MVGRVNFLRFRTFWSGFSLGENYVENDMGSFGVDLISELGTNGFKLDPA